MARILDWQHKEVESIQWLLEAKQIAKDEKWDRPLAWINYYEGKLALRQGNMLSAKTSFELSREQAELFKELILIKYCTAHIEEIEKQS